MNMWKAYEQALREAEETWTEGDIPFVVQAVAAATGLDPVELHDRIAGALLMESHDDGYEYATWFTAWAMRGYPDWNGYVTASRRVTPEGEQEYRLRVAEPGSIDGDQQVGSSGQPGGGAAGGPVLV